MATTVQDIIDGIKWQADLQVGNRLLSADLIPEIDAAYKEGWELIVQQYDDYFMKKVPAFAITGGVGLNAYAITATDFYKLKGIQKLNGSVFGPPLPTHEFNETGAVDELSYRLNDDTVYFEPELSCAGTYRLWYVYSPADLTAAGDAIVDKTGGALKRFIIDTVCVRVKDREPGEDSSVMQAIQARMMTRLQKAAAHRNAGRGRKIADVRRTGRFRFMTRSGLHLPS